MRIINKNAVTAGEVNSLRAAIGFRQIDPELICSRLEGSRNWVLWSLPGSVGVCRCIGA